MYPLLFLRSVSLGYTKREIWRVFFQTVNWNISVVRIFKSRLEVSELNWVRLRVSWPNSREFFMLS
ncbi:hypothetical protein D3C75_502280 [compost metagenome]